ncbi:MmgE/PrpD family protein [Tsukamurella sp. NPDC003166]|uniref:MmgE/PrpD family protein n=1 Tax=Tsukamurella sp. NPDC003166 TaxID=3154444 RepID=UPI0033B28870
MPDARTFPEPMPALVRMILDTRYEDLPESVLRHARYTLLDGMGVMIGGSGMDGIPEIVELVQEKGGAPQTPLPFYGGAYPASEVALALGPMPRAMDCGDLHEEAGHVSEYIVSSLLAATGLRDTPVTGEEFLAATVVGQEVLIRLGSAYKVISTAIPNGDCGGHYIFGAVASIGRLLGLTHEQLENAMGIARTMTQPHTMGIYAPATLMVRVHHGLVSQAAITCVQLALKGITGPREQVLTGPKGFFSSVRWDIDPSGVVEGLGTQWVMENITTKGYSACYFSHSSIDGIIDQMTKGDFGPEDIATIHIAVSPSGWDAVCEPVEKKWAPVTVPELQFSLPFAVASAAYDRTVFLQTYEPAASSRPEVRELMTRISSERDPRVSDWGCRMTTTLRDGREFTDEYVYVKGHPKNPFDEADFVAKFRQCVPYSILPLGEETIDAMIADVLALEKSSDVVETLLRPLLPVEA